MIPQWRMPQNRIKELRSRAGLSASALAQRVGSTQGTISRIENGTRGLSVPFAERIASALGTDVQSVLGITAEKRTEGSPPTPGLTEEAEAYTPGAGEVRIVPPKGTNIVPWRVKSGSLDLVDVLPGDVVYVDVSQEAVEALKPLAKVVAQRFLEDGSAVSVLRQYLPPSLLVTNSRHRNEPPLNVETDDVHVRGVIVSLAWRQLSS